MAVWGYVTCLLEGGEVCNSKKQLLPKISNLLQTCANYEEINKYLAMTKFEMSENGHLERVGSKNIQIK